MADRFKNGITYSQPLFKEITTKSQLELFKDKNLMLILKILREHGSSMTVKEILESFNAESESEKSDKSIYRYLKCLEEGELVVQAGKRVFADKKKLTTQTLYMRSAKIFFPVIKNKNHEKCSEKEEKRKEKLIETVGLLIGNHLGGKLKSVDCLKKYIAEVNIKESELTRKLIQDAEIEVTDSMETFEWKEIDKVVSIVGKLILLSDKSDWQNRLANCYE